MSKGLIREVLDLEQVQRAQDILSKELRASLVLADGDGEFITEYSEFSKFCQKVSCNNKCEMFCLSQANEKVLHSREPFLYQCGLGLINIVIPIKYKGNVEAYILIGQIKSNTKEHTNLNSQLYRLIDEMGIGDLYRDLHYINIEEIIRMKKVIHRILNVFFEIKMENLALSKAYNKGKNISFLKSKLMFYKLNPNFIFNLLNSMNSMAIMENAGATSEMILEASEMVRYLTKSEEFDCHTIGEELDYAERYIHLERLRSGNSLSYIRDVDEELLDYCCPYMLIQPFVENAINYGLFNKEGQGLLKVGIHADGEDLVIEVYDTGMGMCEEKIRKVLDLNRNREDFKEKIGVTISSVNSVLANRYGRGYGVTIDSKVGEYTDIIIRIPRE